MIIVKPLRRLLTWNGVYSSAMISAQDLQISGGIFTQNNYTRKFSLILDD